jgi:signal transduction histidine kinase
VNPLADFFLRNFTEVYFFYGLAFFTMGLAVFLEIGHSSELYFAKALRPLAGFGLVHGSHEWFEMFLIINPELAQGPYASWIALLRLVLLAFSFIMLIDFGTRLISGPTRVNLRVRIYLVIGAIWAAGLVWVVYYLPPGTQRAVAADVYTRYALAFPGAALTVWGLFIQRRRFIDQGMPSFGRDVAIAAVAFGLYGCIGQLFSSPSIIFPSTYLNSANFVQWFGFPIQVFRAAMATVAALFIIRSLRSFEEENRRRIDALNAAQIKERQRLEALRAELLHRTVQAQESERLRIARELHDETGQTLTALGLGLRGLASTIPFNPGRAVQQAAHLEKLAADGIEELQRMVSGLHPPQLDDLGLVAALRWYANEIHHHYGITTKVNSPQQIQDITPEIRIVLFRIAQEAITNTVRHSHAQHITVCLETTNKQARLIIDDDGQGFDVAAALAPEAERKCWGLMGMMERAGLMNGECKITSQPEKGVHIEAIIPLEALANVSD